MNKSTEYYEDLDLEALSKTLPTGKEKQKSDEYQELIIAIVEQSRSKSISSSILVKLLGEPDKKYQFKESIIYSYSWIGKHGPNEYESETPFVLKEDKIIGLLKEDQTIN
jgi:hypothetical protein